jgi:hypothetical protein
MHADKKGCTQRQWRGSYPPMFNLMALRARHSASNTCTCPARPSAATRGGYCADLFFDHPEGSLGLFELMDV